MHNGVKKKIKLEKVSSPITISDSSRTRSSICSLRKARSNGDEVVEIDSSSNQSERVPVSWPPLTPRVSILNDNTPSCVDKVEKWMGTSRNILNANERVSDCLNGNTFIRCDFEKSDTSQSSSLLKRKGALAQNQSINQNEVINISSDSSKTTEERYVDPESPETKKKELCRYLKLMNPADKKEVLEVQNRRSIRVKNLNMLLERKELDKKLRKEFYFDRNETTKGNLSKMDQHEWASENLALKSFKDLNMKVDTPNEDTSLDNDGNKIWFNFILPSPKVLNRQEDFDVSIVDIITDVKGSKISSAKVVQSLKKLNGNFSSPVRDTKFSISGTNKFKIRLRNVPRSKTKTRKLLDRNKVPPKTWTMVTINGKRKKIFLKKYNPEMLPASGATASESRNQRLLRRQLRIRNSSMRLLRSRTVSTETKAKRKQTKNSRRSSGGDRKERGTNGSKHSTLESSKRSILGNSKPSTLENSEASALENSKTSTLENSKTLTLENSKPLILGNSPSILGNSKSSILGNSKSSILGNSKSSILGNSKPSILENSKPSTLESPKIMKKDVTEVVYLPETNLTEAASEAMISSRIEFEQVTVKENWLDLVDDPEEYTLMSDEHKKLLIESRIHPKTPNSTISLPSSCSKGSFHGFDRSDFPNNNFCEFYKENSPERQLEPKNFTLYSLLQGQNTSNYHETDAGMEKIESLFADVNRKDIVEEYPSNIRESYEGSEFPDHSTTDAHISNTSDSTSVSVSSGSKSRSPSPQVPYNPTPIPNQNHTLVPLNKNVEMTTLHSSLMRTKKKRLSDLENGHDWESDGSSPKSAKIERKRDRSHAIIIEKDNGPVRKAIYSDFYLAVVQEYAVSLWNQTALGNILGAQNLWVSYGWTPKLVLNKECIQKDSREMVYSSDNSVAYIELWTKEHKSDIREGPVADVFATIYFWRRKQNKLYKKVLQLENINGFADDVQYVVLKASLSIIVSWHSVIETYKKTLIHMYDLAPDFQSVTNIRELESVEHYVSSLHNIEDCELLAMGCGESKISLWNTEHGYIVATIELAAIKTPLSTLWAKSDRGILFVIQQCVDRELRLIAINGRNGSWKKLMSYTPPEGFDRLQGVYVERGILVSFYEQGILCWNAQTGEPIVEELPNETEYIASGKYVILVVDDQIIIRDALIHLITAEDS